MRVRLSIDEIALDHNARAAGEARQRKVEAVPEELDGARLADEPAAELLEARESTSRGRGGSARPRRDPTTACSVSSRERRRHRHAERLFSDRDVDTEVGERGVETHVEVGDRETVVELERTRAPAWVRTTSS